MRSLISTFVVRCLDSIIPLLVCSWNFKTLASLCSRAGQLRGLHGRKLRRQVFSWRGSYLDITRSCLDFTVAWWCLRAQPIALRRRSLTSFRKKFLSKFRVSPCSIFLLLSRLKLGRSEPDSPKLPSRLSPVSIFMDPKHSLINVLFWSLIWKT